MVTSPFDGTVTWKGTLARKQIKEADMPSRQCLSSLMALSGIVRHRSQPNSFGFKWNFAYHVPSTDFIARRLSCIITICQIEYRVVVPMEMNLFTFGQRALLRATISSLTG